MNSSPSSLGDVERVLKAAADPTRARILKLLESGPLCVCQVQAVLGLAASTVSKHLSLLRAAGFVSDQRDGKWVAYSLAREDRNTCVAAVLEALRDPLDDDSTVAEDRSRLREVLRVPRARFCDDTIDRERKR